MSRIVEAEGICRCRNRVTFDQKTFGFIDDELTDKPNGGLSGFFFNQITEIIGSHAQSSCTFPDSGLPFGKLLVIGVIIVENILKTSDYMARFFIWQIEMSIVKCLAVSQ